MVNGAASIVQSVPGPKSDTSGLKRAKAVEKYLSLEVRQQLLHSWSPIKQCIPDQVWQNLAVEGEGGT